MKMQLKNFTLETRLSLNIVVAIIGAFTTSKFHISILRFFYEGDIVVKYCGSGTTNNSNPARLKDKVEELYPLMMMIRKSLK